MTDAELRALVRETVSRHLRAAGQQGVPVPPTIAPPVSSRPDAAGGWGRHASHHLYLTLVNTTEACVIEPAVPCDHCGYCRSHGH